jgi:hypothetical protein
MPSAPTVSRSSEAQPPAPEPLTVHYSAWKVGAIALFIAHLSAWWVWRSVAVLLAAEVRTFHLWFTPTLGVVLTLALLGGIVALFFGKTSVVVVDETGLTVPDLYEDRIPWGAIGRITLVRGRGVVFEVTDGPSYGRRMTRNVRAANHAGSVDMACIRSGLLDQPSQVILDRLQAYTAHRDAKQSNRR